MSSHSRARGVVCAGLVAGALALAWAWRHSTLPDPRASSGPTVRLVAGEEEIAVLQGLSRQSQVWFPLGRIPRHVVDAVLAAEDRRFFRHSGIDLWAILRAAAADLRAGRLVQGGSTITQQVARTLFLNRDRTWGRKVRESAIAVLLEARYPKDRILEAYLNRVYLGHDGGTAVHGMGAAARHYLGKELSAVRPDEAALLAAAIRAPNRILGGDAAQMTVRRDSILQTMQADGTLGGAEAREAMAHPVRRTIGRPARAPYFVDLARKEIAWRVALPASGEIRIATSLDPVLQRVAEAAIRDRLDRIDRRRPDLPPGKLQAALVAVEPGTGKIRALVGGRRYLEGPFNRAARAARQPGSLFKPFVYLAAFEAEREGSPLRLTPASLVPDEPLTLQTDGGPWTPHNLDRRFRGLVTVRRALEESLNVPAVQVARQVGLDRVVAMARALGIQSPLAPVPSLALGTSEVTLLEITGAYAALANGGLRVTPTTLAMPGSGEGERAVSGASAFLVTHLLRGVMRDGTGRSSARWGLSDLAAGKTGTTDGLRDAWFVGYTPELAVGVWVGMDDDSPIGLTGAQAALPIWAAVMQAAVRRAPPRPFTPPAGILMASVERDTGRLASFWCGGGPRVEEAFRAGTEPPPACGGMVPGALARSALGWLQGLFR